MDGFTQGIRKCEEFCEKYGLPMYELRRIASDHLSRELADMYGPDHGMGISSSDTSHHMSSMARYEPEALFDAARPLALIAQAAKGSGKTYEEFKDLARRMFEPA